MSAMSELHAEAGRIGRLNPHGVRYTGQGGTIFDHGSAMHPAFVPELLAAYQRSAQSGDWWAPEALRLAAELERAMRDAGLIQKDAA